jgi:hypothetical protein
VPEPEFLPAWYPKARRRRRWLLIQAWSSVGLIAVLGICFLLSSRNVWRGKVMVNQLNHEMDQANDELVRLTNLVKLHDRLIKQEQVMRRIGVFVEPTRALKLVETAISPDISLVSASFEQVDGAAPSVKDGAKAPPVVRTMQARIHGVAPTDIDIGNFVQSLNAITFVEAVTLSYSRERMEKGHVMREFEVSFAINLTQQEGS